MGPEPRLLPSWFLEKSFSAASPPEQRVPGHLLALISLGWFSFLGEGLPGPPGPPGSLLTSSGNARSQITPVLHLSPGSNPSTCCGHGHAVFLTYSPRFPLLTFHHGCVCINTVSPAAWKEGADVNPATLRAPGSLTWGRQLIYPWGVSGLTGET